MENKIVDDGYKVVRTVKKAASGGVVVSLGLVVMSWFHGLTPVEYKAGLIVVCSVLEAARNLLKKKFPGVFSFL